MIRFSTFGQQHEGHPKAIVGLHLLVEGKSPEMFQQLVDKSQADDPDEWQRHYDLLGGCALYDEDGDRID